MEFIRENKLLPFVEWSQYIAGLKKKVTPIIETPDKVVAQSISESVKRHLPKGRFGLFLSGGVDSSLLALLCRQHTKDFICYTVGLEGSHDIMAAIEVAESLGLNHKYKVIPLDELENLFLRTARILGEELNIVNLGVGAVEVAAVELALKDNIRIFMGGLGSEEIFAGYDRHVKAKDTNEECWAGLISTWERDFKRDFLISRHFKTEFVTPYLDERLIIDSMGVPGGLKIKDKIKKYVLRQAAGLLGLPESVAWRPKKAAQYGSSIDKGIAKLTRQHGFRYKKEYLQFLREHK